MIAAKLKFSLGLVSATCKDVSFRVSQSLVFTFNCSFSDVLSDAERYKSHRMLALLYRLSKQFLFLLMLVPSCSVSNEMVNFCLITYPSGSYSFSLRVFLVQNCLLFSKKKPTVFPWGSYAFTVEQEWQVTRLGKNYINFLSILTGGEEEMSLA